MPRPLAKVELTKMQYSAVPLAVHDDALVQARLAGLWLSPGRYFVMSVSLEHTGVDKRGKDRDNGE